MNLLDILNKPGAIAKTYLLDILQCNQKSGHYGLALSEEEALELLEVRNQSIIDNGRVELNIEPLKKIITAFCSSPSIDSSDYSSVLTELVEAFYLMKNETGDKISDEELITIMKDLFDGSSNGSIELLKHRDLPLWSRKLRTQL